MSLLSVKIVDPTVRSFEGVNLKGKPYVMRSQSCFIGKDEEVKKCNISLHEHQSPYPAGRYSLDPVSLLEFGKFGIEYNKYAEIILVPVLADKPQALFAKTV